MNDVRINYRVLSNKKVFKNLRFHMCRYLNLKSVKTSGLKVAHKLFQVLNLLLSILSKFMSASFKGQYYGNTVLFFTTDRDALKG